MSRPTSNLRRACFAVVTLSMLSTCAWPQSQPIGTDNRSSETNAAETINQPAEQPAATTPAAQADQVVDLTCARSVIRSFLAAAAVGDYSKTARMIDFDSMPEPPSQKVRENLAFKLAEVLTSHLEVNIETVSDDPNGQPVLLPAGTPESTIEIAKSRDGQWRFTARTAGQIEELNDQHTAETTQVITAENGVEDVDESDPNSVAEPKQAIALDSARATMRTFLTAAGDGDYDLAAQTMDFSLLPSPTDERKAKLAFQLKEVIDRMQWVDFVKIPSGPNAGPFLFPIGLDTQPIEIAKGPDNQWRFTRETVARLDGLYEGLKDKPKVVKGWLPFWMQTPLVADNEGWRIVLLFVVILISLLVAWLIQLGTHRCAIVLQQRQPIAASFFESLGSSLTPLLLWLGVWFSFQWLVLDDVVRGLVDSILSVLLVMAVAYVLYRLVDVVDAWIHAFADTTQSKLDNMLAPLLRRSLRTTIIILALVQIASILSHKPPASIIAGLGVASIAIGLAAQDTIKNVFGSVMLLTDRPFEVGDRVVIGEHDGPVETVGFRSTRIRTLAGHLVTIPNGELASQTIQNVGKRPHIRRTMDVTITYDTAAEKIERAIEIIKDILADHEGMHPDLPPRVYFNEFKDTSLNVAVVYWYHPPDYWAFSAFNERVNLEIFRRYEAEGIEFAFPTQTLYLAGDPNRPLNVGAQSDETSRHSTPRANPEDLAGGEGSRSDA